MKNYKVKIFALIIFVASFSVILLITIYENILPASTITLENLYGDSSCSWPCWQGITPGVTTNVEAIQKLKNSPLISENSIQLKELNMGFSKTTWYWEIDDISELFGEIKWQHGEMMSDNGMVYFIRLYTYRVFSLEQAINKFGIPEKIEVIDCTEIVEAPQRFCGSLYYAKKGFEININWERTKDGRVQISPSDPIKSVVLFKPSTIEEWLLSWSLDLEQLDLRNWKGYGDLYDLYIQ